MNILPINVRLALATSCCTLVLLGLALAASAFIGQPELIVIATVALVTVAAGSSLLLGWQVARLLREQKRLMDQLAGRFTIFDTPEAPANINPPVQFPAKPSVASPADETRQAQRNEAVNRLRDGIVHDLNNRLMVISANADAVARHLKDQPILQRKLLSALVASDQASSLIARTTAFAEQQEHNVQYVELGERIEAVAALLSRSLLRDTVALRTAVDDETWPVQVDPGDLETALVILCANLRDTLSQGDTITIRAHNITVAKGELSRGELEGDFVRISIGTSAEGDMPHAVPGGRQEGAFTMQDMDLASWVEFNRNLLFLQPLGGMAEVETVGTESVVALYLPRARTRPLIVPVAARDEETFEDTVRERVDILVVDDEIEVALALQTMLEEFGYTVRIATSASQALKGLRTRKPNLLLADAAMPGAMNGVALAREMRQVLPDLPVLLITGNPRVSESDSEFPLLKKPILSRSLHAAIQRQLAAETGKVVTLFPRTARHGH